MVTVPMTLEARIKLGYILIQLTGTQEEIGTWGDIGTVIKVTDDEKATLNLKEIRNATGDLQGATWNPLVPELTQPQGFQLETEHAKKLLQLLQTYGGFRSTDLTWVRATNAALKAVV